MFFQLDKLVNRNWNTVLQFFVIKWNIYTSCKKHALIPELRASGCFFSCPTVDFCTCSPGFTVEETRLVVGLVTVVDVVITLVTFTVVLVFCEVGLSEEDVVWVPVTELEAVVDAFVVLLTVLVSSAPEEVVLEPEVVFDVVWADVEAFVVLEVEFAGKRVVVPFVLRTVEEDWFVVTSADVVKGEVNIDELDAVVAAAVVVTAVVVTVDCDDVSAVLPPNIIQPSCHNKQKQQPKRHKKSTLTYAQYVMSTLTTSCTKTTSSKQETLTWSCFKGIVSPKM